METIRDIIIGWEKGDKFAEVNTPHCRISGRLKKLHEKYPDEFDKYVENKDGSIYAKVPVKWIKIIRPSGNHREFTEEEKKANAERLRKMWEIRRAQAFKK